MRDFSPTPGWGATVVSNPPYGVRLAEVETLIPLYESLGRVLKERCKGFHIHLFLADGRLVNLAAAEGHPSEVMDMSFANQFMAHLKLVQMHEGDDILEPKIYDLPESLDQEIARIKLETMGLAIDALSEEQMVYATDYSAGT